MVSNGLHDPKCLILKGVVKDKIIFIKTLKGIV